MQSNKLLRAFVRSQLNELKIDTMITGATKGFFKNMPDPDREDKGRPRQDHKASEKTTLAQVGKFATEAWVDAHKDAGMKLTSDVQKKAADETKMTYAQLHKTNQNSHKKALAALVKNLDAKFAPQNKLSPAQTQEIIVQVFDEFTSK